MRRRDEGAVAVEFALLVPLLIAILLAIIDYGLWYSDSVTLRSAAAEAARAGATGNYPPPCAAPGLEPAEKVACVAVEGASLIGGTQAARVYVLDGAGGGSWERTKTLIVCTTLKEDGVTGLTPLPSDGILRTRVATRLEADQGGDSQMADSDPGGGSWDWC